MASAKIISQQNFAHRLFGSGSAFCISLGKHFRGQRGAPRPVRAGICVSGGPDSMLLAYLLKNAVHPDDHTSAAFIPHGLIVDHGARPGSRDEALQVQRHLLDFGVKSTVMTIDWPQGVDPAMSPGFEEAARRERYKLLLRTAIQVRCAAIFTGHHQDDQVETLLMRMVRNRNLNLAGCHGIKEISSPSSFGDLMGVDLLGQDRISALDSSSSTEPVVSDATQYWFDEVLISGIKSCRPLLRFTKAQIFETCEHFKVPYVLDRTNYDPTHTIRNAIRHLRRQNLPHALQASRLLAVREHADTYHSDAEMLMASFKDEVTRFRVHRQLGAIDVCLHSSVTEHDLALRYFLARSIDFISPSTNPSSLELYANPGMTDSIRAYVKEINTAMFHSNAWTECSQESERPVPVLGRSLKFAPMKLHEHKVAIEIHYHETVAKSNEIRLVLSRRPASRTETATDTKSFTVMPDPVIAAGGTSIFCSEWVLWDGRFWVQAQSHSAAIISEVEMRYLTKEEAQRLERSRKLDLVKSSLRSLRLPSNVSNQGLYTLPIFSIKGNVFAFPTLNVMLDQAVPVSWNVKYLRNVRAVQAFSKIFPEMFTIHDSVEDIDIRI